MSDPHLPVPAALRVHRDRTIESLCAHFAADHLEAEELEQLIDQAHEARTVAELEGLVSSLPVLARDARITAEDSAGRSYSPVPAHDRAEHQAVLALMGGAERKGAWTPARQVYVAAMMGGVDLDFREAHLDPGVTEVYVFALMGGVDIVVPPGVRVDSSGIGLMGGFEHANQGKMPVDTSVPVLRIMGLALMGGVDITVRHPGETARDARKRLKATQKELRARNREDLR
jgi:hypothetical protein